MKRLRFVQFNLENLFIFLDRYGGDELQVMSEDLWQKQTCSTVGNKPLEKLRQLSQVVIELDADFYLFNEVGGLESLENFNKHFLDDRFDVLLLEGNSDRGIDVGYLVKKQLPYKYLQISHKDRLIDLRFPKDPVGQKHYMSRDISELRVFDRDSNICRLVILLVHLKSKLDPDGIDQQGRKRRAAELKALVDVYNEVSSEFTGDTAVMVAGDMNGTASKLEMEEEFAYLHESSDLKDVFDLAQIPPEERYTQVQINSSGKRKLLQLDYIFISPHWAGQLNKDESGVYRFKDEYGLPLKPPTSLEERLLMPSDHYPVIATFEFDQK